MVDAWTTRSTVVLVLPVSYRVSWLELTGSHLLLHTLASLEVCGAHALRHGTILLELRLSAQPRIFGGHLLLSRSNR